VGFYRYLPGTNTPLGYNLNQGSGPFCESRRLAELIKSGHAWDLEALTVAKLRLWRCIDSEGLLEALMQARELEEKR